MIQRGTASVPPGWPTAGGPSLGRVTGVFLLASVAVGYLLSLRVGLWPPGHPWSGFTLTSLAFLLFFLPTGAPERRARALRIGHAILAILAAGFWLSSVLIEVSR